MYNLKRTNSDDLDFQKLVVELDKDLAIKDTTTKAAVLHSGKPLCIFLRIIENNK